MIHNPQGRRHPPPLVQVQPPSRAGAHGLQPATQTTKQEERKMMLEEFEARTGFYPSHDLYARIEAAYTESTLDKDAFCKAYKANKDGMAEAIAREASMAAFSTERKNKAETAHAIAELQKQVERLTRELDRELDWQPYEMRENVKQADYAELAKGAEAGLSSHYMTDEEAIQWICDEYDFQPGKITILHEVPQYEKSKHNQLRKTGKVFDRRPVYCATDYHYIRFNTSRFYYEVWNGQLQPFFA
jgi:hypothetical protein